MDVPALPEHLASRKEAMRANTLIQVGCAVLALGFILGASGHQRAINQKRADLQLFLSDELYSAMPPDLAFLATALGTFRGLAVDFLWIRGENLKQEGKYFEALQLSEWLCKLQPRFATVWMYHAWNMAYNISVGTYSPEQRWKWVYNGIKLLRDEGRQYNPKDIGIYRELAWIFFHKMGDIMDDYHIVYKRVWAGMFERVLGRPGVDPDRAEAIEVFRPIAQAPTSLETLRTTSPDAADVLDRLAEMNVRLYDPRIETLPLAEDHSFLGALCKYGPNGVMLSLSEYVDTAKSKPQDPQPLIELIQDPKAAKGRNEVAAYVRANVLRDVFKMDPGFMLKLMEEYGPMDWRSVYAHSLYWSKLGVDRCRDIRRPETTHTVTSFRIVFFSLAQLFRQGNIVYEQNIEDPLRSYFHSRPSPSFVDALHNVYLTLGKIGTDAIESGAYRTGEAAQAETPENVPDKLFRAGHANFLCDAISILYLSGREDDYQKAEFYYEYLRENFRNDDGSVMEGYLRPLEDFVFSLFSEQLEIRKYTEAMINQSIHAAFYELMVGRTEGYKRRMKAAENFWRIYRKRIPDYSIDGHNPRQKLPSIPEFRQGVLEYMLAREPIDTILKARLWNRCMVDLDLTRGVYDQAIGYLRRECKTRGIDVAKAFPEPPGMKEYRARLPKERESPDVEVHEGSKR